jgi:hypothetical protein
MSKEIDTPGTAAKDYCDLYVGNPAHLSQEELKIWDACRNAFLGGTEYNTAPTYEQIEAALKKGFTAYNSPVIQSTLVITLDTIRALYEGREKG